jgi:hypothetical protein
VEVAKDMRWSLVSFAAILALGVAGCGGGTKTVTETQTVVETTTEQATTQQAPSSATACTGDAMSGSFTVVPGSGAAGQISYRLRVKNDSPVACFVSGLPIVQLVDQAGHDLPTNVQPAKPGQATAARIILQPDASASAEARFSPDVPGGSEQTDGPCEPKAQTLRVSLAGAPLDVPITPPTPVCERGSLSFSLLTAG